MKNSFVVKGNVCQTKNAQEYEKHGAIKLLRETEQINEDLNFAVRELCEDNALREKMRSAYEKVGNIGAADKIIDLMLKAMNI